MDIHHVTLVFMCLVIYTLEFSHGLRLGSFNLKVFGKSKASKPDVMEIIVKIISRYDIVLLMEIRDASGDANKILMEMLEKNKEATAKYGYIISNRLGRSKSKEEYAFVYRKDLGIKVVDSYHYDDGSEEAKTDTFEREPFVVRFSSDRTVVPEFSLVGIHTNPSKALPEIISLMDVYEDASRRWESDDVIILGDLNADCNYVRKKAWPDVTIRNDPYFYWPIGDGVDTTVGKTDCAYDRFIISGKMLRNNIVNDSVRVFDFKDEYKLSQDEAEDVSDHYPIELELTETNVVGRGTQPRSHFLPVVIASLLVVGLCQCCVSR